MPAAVDLTGKQFGRLTVVGFAGRDHKKRRLWLCKCSCGAEKTKTYGALTVNGVKSCGCLLRDAITKHGASGTRLYHVWHAMLERCRNPSDAAFKDYGLRGISVCDEWHDFVRFKSDMGQRPQKASLDRIDVNGDYCKENCRWATPVEQANNRRNNIRIEHRGTVMTVSEWARHLGMSKRALQYRLASRYWTIERALETPVSRSRNVSAARRNLFKEQ